MFKRGERVVVNIPGESSKYKGRQGIVAHTQQEGKVCVGVRFLEGNTLYYFHVDFVKGVETSGRAE